MVDFSCEKRDKYDCFISHACEDKDSFVRELALSLQDRGFKVWYDEFTLRLGNSLCNSIDRGIANSTCGIVVLSKNFFNKQWTKEELNRLSAKKNSTGKDIILPIWHNITQKEVYHHSPMLADLYAVKTKDGMNKVCTEIERAIKELRVLSDNP